MVLEDVLRCPCLSQAPVLGDPAHSQHMGSQAIAPQGGPQSAATTWGGSLWSSGEPLVPSQHVCGISGVPILWPMSKGALDVG